MNAAQGEVQEKGYQASFPALINVSGEATYIMVLKDANGIVKQYALVNVEHYSLVATGDTQAEAMTAYKKLLAQNGIVSGISESEFAPNINITREQIVAIFHRYAKLKGYDVSAGEDTSIHEYDDAHHVSDFANDSMKYAVGSGLIKGKTEDTLNPKDNATRAEFAAIIERFIKANK
jgi:hypothetical protein